VGGLALVVRAVLLGSCLVARERVDPAELADLLDRGEVTHASLVPVMLRRLLAARSDGPPRPGGCLLVGGAHAPPELVERAVEAGLPVALTYGLSEASSQVATAPPGLVRRKPGTVGHPLPGVELRLGPGGEIRVRGPTVSPGYLTPGPEGAPVLEPVAGPDGWLSTGDLGAVDEEGHLRVRGRRSARIVSGGVTVDPGEVERVLREHPRVAEAAVVGLPDETWGERVAALVVPTGPLEEGELDRWARARLSPGWIPRRYRFREALPRNATGKVDREAVRAGLAR
jgi:O-succinylbenzoic acid--CoA ligase